MTDGYRLSIHRWFALPVPRRIARSLERSAERSRAGDQLPRAQRARLEAEKDELHALFGRARHARARRRGRR